MEAWRLWLQGQVAGAASRACVAQEGFRDKDTGEQELGPRPLLPVTVSELCPSLAGRVGAMPTLIEPEGLGEEGAKLGFVRALFNRVELHLGGALLKCWRGE